MYDSPFPLGLGSTLTLKIENPGILMINIAHAYPFHFQESKGFATLETHNPESVSNVSISAAMDIFVRLSHNIMIPL